MGHSGFQLCCGMAFVSLILRDSQSGATSSKNETIVEAGTGLSWQRAHLLWRKPSFVSSTAQVWDTHLELQHGEVEVERGKSRFRGHPELHKPQGQLGLHEKRQVFSWDVSFASNRTSEISITSICSTMSSVYSPLHPHTQTS